METDLSKLSPTDLRAAAQHSDPRIAEVLESLAQAIERGERPTPQALGVDAQQLLAVAGQLLPQLKASLAPLKVSLGALQRQLTELPSLQAQAQAQLSQLLQHISDPQARAHATQAMAQLQASARPETLSALLERVQALADALPEAVQQALDNPSQGPATGARLQDIAASLEALQGELEQAQTSLHGASASLGMACASARAAEDPITPLLLALRASLVHGLDGDALQVWEQTFDAAAHFGNYSIAQTASRLLLVDALEREAWKRAALIQHLLAELSPESQRFDHRLQEALLLSKIGGFQDSIRALLSECASLADGIPQRARLQLTQGEILERLGDLKGAQRSWTRLIDLPNVQNEAPALQARGLAFLGEALLSESNPKASPLLEAAIDRGEAAGDWSAVGYAAQALLPLLREQDPERASDLAERLRDIAGRLQPEALPALDQWLG